MKSIVESHELQDKLLSSIQIILPYPIEYPTGYAVKGLTIINVATLARKIGLYIHTCIKKSTRG